MPNAANPDRTEFYVYWLRADGIPFYVGVGRAARASDRVRYVRYQQARELQGKPVKWSPSARVVAGLLDAGCEVDVAYPAKSLTRVGALTRERIEIDALLAAGFVLANIQHNPCRPGEPETVVQSVLLRCGSSK